MYAVLPLHSTFLRTSFKEVRLVLLGDLVTTSLSTATIVEPKHQKYLLTLVKSRFFQAFLSILIVASISMIAVLTVPDLYYHLFPADTLAITPSEKGSPLGGDFALGSDGADNSDSTPVPSPSPALPPQDMTLPEGRWLIIPRIGVRTELQETEDSEDALATGVWMVPDFGDPGSTDVPLILAAHRFGWKWWWQDDYWRYHSFYLLPDTEPGDLVEVIDDHRKYVYEIYAGEEGDEITDYDADLILYTCKFLNSPIRHFRYARLVDWQKNTQL